jgi:hypothetical protein
MDHEANLEARAALFKALGHPVRLLIVNLIDRQPRHGQELAEILNLKPATISHHLGKLSDVGLLRSQQEQYYHVYSLTGEALGQRLGDLVRLPQPGLEQEVETDAYRAKVLRTFMRHGRIKQIPSQQKKWLVILERLADEFEPNREYPEQQVNQILVEFHEDVATLRRDLIDFEFMTRNRGIYRKVMDRNG